jgi:hypothetical protein
MANQSTSFADNQTEIVTSAPVDASGNPGVLTGVPTYSQSSTGIVNISSDPTGLILTLVAAAPGSTNVTLSGLSAAGAFSSTFGVTVTGGPAVGFNFSFGTPTTTA